MATIYRFIVESKTSDGGGTGRGSKGGTATKGAGKKGKYVPLFGGPKGGVEHNRKMRAINPILNKVTGGVWEKGMRLGRAAGGLIKVNDKTGQIKLGGPAIAIIIAFILQTVWNFVAKYNNHARQIAERENAQNFTRLENGGGAIHGSYSIARDLWSGKQTYNENK